VNAPGAAVSVDIVVPVYNEELILRSSVGRLRSYLDDTFPYPWRIVIADNASTDATSSIAEELAAEDDRIAHIRLEQKGRGRALRAAWSASEADIVVYTDVDLSTGLTGLLPLVAPLASEHSDLAIGSRLSSGSVVARGPKRELISRAYNLLLRLVFAVRFRDAQCGFKAARTDIVKLLLPAVEDVRTTALADLAGVRRMAMRFLRGNGHVELGPYERRPLGDDFGRQTVTYVMIGIVSTLISLGVFLALRNEIGAIWANFVAFTVTVLGNNWANRRWTFRRSSDEDRLWRYLTSFAVYVVSLLVTTLALASVEGNSSLELLMLLVTWGIAAVLRFVVLRGWVYRRSGAHGGQSHGPSAKSP
jgi:glycosyltransferase involved in cell wall biosynthesis